MPTRIVVVLWLVAVAIGGCLDEAEGPPKASDDSGGADEGIGDPCTEPETYDDEIIVVYNKLNHSITVELSLFMQVGSTPFWNDTVTVGPHPGGVSYRERTITELPPVAPGEYRLQATVLGENTTRTNEVHFECHTFGIDILVPESGIPWISQGAA